MDKMETITINKKELKRVVKESLKEVLEKEMMENRALLIPYVSKAEQKDIDNRYRVPTRKTSKSVKVKI